MLIDIVCLHAFTQLKGKGGKYSRVILVAHFEVLIRIDAEVFVFVVYLNKVPKGIVFYIVCANIV